MRLLTLEQRKFSVYAVVEEEADGGYTCPALQFLRDAPGDMQGSARGVSVLFRRYAEGGRQALTTELFHEADKTDGIWQFIKGRLRLLVFMDGGRVVVVSHGYIKRSQRADRQEVAAAIAAKKKYLEAKAARRIRVIPLE